MKVLSKVSFITLSIVLYSCGMQSTQDQSQVLTGEKEKKVEGERKKRLETLREKMSLSERTTTSSVSADAIYLRKSIEKSQKPFVPDSMRDWRMMPDVIWDPLHSAILSGNEEEVISLLRKRTPVNRTCNGETPVSLAVWTGNLRMVELVWNEKTLGMFNSENLTPLDIAVRIGHPDIISFLKKRQAPTYINAKRAQDSYEENYQKRAAIPLVTHGPRMGQPMTLKEIPRDQLHYINHAKVILREHEEAAGYPASYEALGISLPGGPVGSIVKQHGQRYPWRD